MLENHVTVSLNDKSFGYLSFDPNPKNLIVFVHGFGGSGKESTWGYFEVLAKNDTRLKDSDIIFYDYDNKKKQLTTNALLLYRFLSDLQIQVDELDIGLSRKIDKYERIIFLAHSAGAFVVRKALLFGNSDNCTWVKLCKMILFAPAHYGARLQTLLDCIPDPFQFIAGFTKVYVPSIVDLMPESLALKNLAEETKNLIPSSQNISIPANVIWAEFEKVVFNDQFNNDPVPIIMKGHDHKSVCKPDAIDYTAPYNLLINQLI